MKSKIFYCLFIGFINFFFHACSDLPRQKERSYSNTQKPPINYACIVLKFNSKLEKFDSIRIKKEFTDESNNIKNSIKEIKEYYKNYFLSETDNLTFKDDEGILFLNEKGEESLNHLKKLTKNLTKDITPEIIEKSINYVHFIWEFVIGLEKFNFIRIKKEFIHESNNIQNSIKEIKKNKDYFLSKSGRDDLTFKDAKDILFLNEKGEESLNHLKKLTKDITPKIVFGNNKLYKKMIKNIFSIIKKYYTNLSSVIGLNPEIFKKLQIIYIDLEKYFISDENDKIKFKSDITKLKIDIQRDITKLKIDIQRDMLCEKFDEYFNEILNNLDKVFNY